MTDENSKKKPPPNPFKISRDDWRRAVEETRAEESTDDERIRQRIQSGQQKKSDGNRGP